MPSLLSQQTLSTYEPGLLVAQPTSGRSQLRQEAWLCCSPHTKFGTSHMCMRGMPAACANLLQLQSFAAGTSKHCGRTRVHTHGQGTATPCAATQHQGPTLPPAPATAMQAL